MKRLHSTVRLRLAVLSLALATVALIGAACAPSTAPTAAAPTQIAAPPAPATKPPATAPAAEKAGPVAPGSAAKPAALSNVPTGVDADGNFYRGDPKAPVKLVEFSDFECPYCSRHAVQTEPLIDEAYVATGKVQHFFRHLPLPQLGHTNAIPAAQAAYCAGQQDPKYFWGLHDWLFANQGVWSGQQDAPDQFRKQALALGADGARYDACLADPQTDARLDRDAQDAVNMGVQGTPAFFINDWFLAGAYPYADFQSVIAKAEQGLHPPPTPTPLPPGAEPYDVSSDRPGFTYDGSPTQGSEKAPILVFVFTDLGCPGCVEFTKTIVPMLMEKYVKPGQARLIYKFLPATSPKAAIAGLCAADQGKLAEFAAALAAKRDEWKDGDNAAMIGYAKASGLDAAKFEKCLTDAPGQAQIDQDVSLAQEVQVTQVPYFLVLNPDLQTGLRVPQLVPAEEFEKAIQDVQKTQSAAPPAASQPTPAAVASAGRPDMPMGVDANGNFYRGNPNAPVKIVEYSDFQ
jgi:protein-disulfide isomerase